MKPKLSYPQHNRRIQPLRTSFQHPPPTFRGRPCPPPRAAAIAPALSACRRRRRHRPRRRPVSKYGQRGKDALAHSPSRTRAAPALIKCAAIALNARPQRVTTPSPTSYSPPPTRPRSPPRSTRPPLLPSSRARYGGHCTRYDTSTSEPYVHANSNRKFTAD